MGLALLFACIPVLHSPGEAMSDEYVMPQNAWPAAESVPAIEGEGFGLGEVVEHRSGPDQNGDTVDLWQFYGQVWVMDVSTIWCQPCQDMAATLQETADAYKDQGFVYVTVLAENELGSVPEEADLDFWAETWGIVDQPVVSDTEGFTAPITGGQFPLLLVIDRDLTVAAQVLVPEDAQLREAVEELL